MNEIDKTLFSNSNAIEQIKIGNRISRNGQRKVAGTMIVNNMYLNEFKSNGAAENPFINKVKMAATV